MKRLLAILLTCVMTIGITVLPANAGVDYSRYEGSWYEGNGRAFVHITDCSDTSISFNYLSGLTTYELNNLPMKDGVATGTYTCNVLDEDHHGRVKLELKADCIMFTETEGGESTTYRLINDLFVYRKIEEVNCKIIIDGQTLYTEQTPIMINDHTMVPMRAIFEKLGYTVEWDAEHQTIFATKDGNYLRMDINNEQMSYNGRTMKLEIPPTIMGNYTMVPVRAISEASGYKVYWDGDTKTIKIVSGINSADYSKYIGSYSVTSNEGTRHESTITLNIKSIDGNTIDFDCTLIPPRHIISMTANQGTFTGENTAIASGTYDIDGQVSPIQYEFKFHDNSIDFRYTFINDGRTLEYTTFYLK